MKKFYILILLLLFSTNVFAGTISIAPFISGNDVTIAHLESQRTTISNAINGNIAGGVNILAGSLVSQDFSASVSPVTRWGEAFNNFTYTGMLPVTDATLTSNISSGTSYVSGTRVVIGTTAHTYAASKDTYVYVNQGGFYNFDPVANGATAPTNYTAANGNLLLAVVVTSGTAITSVTDSRVLGISLSSGTNIVPTDYRVQMYCMQATTTTITVQPGIIEVNGTRIIKTVATTLTLTTAGDWAGGSSQQAINTVGYIGIDSSGNIKMNTTAPTNSNYSLSVTNGTKRYVSWSGTTYRVIGWFYMNSTGSGQLNAWRVSNVADGAVKNVVFYETGAVATGSTAIPNDDTIPQANEGNQFMSADFVPTNASDTIAVSTVAVLSNGSDVNGEVLYLSQDAGNAIAVTYMDGGAATEPNIFTLNHYMKAGSTSLTNFKVIGGGDAGTTTFNGIGGARRYGGVIASSIRVEEIESEQTS